MTVTPEQLEAWRRDRDQAHAERLRLDNVLEDLGQLIEIGERIVERGRPVEPAPSAKPTRASGQARAATPTQPIGELNARQARMVDLARKGETPKAIAAIMNIEVQTIHATFSALRKRGHDVPRFSTSGRKTQERVAIAGPVSAAPAAPPPVAIEQLTPAMDGASPPAPAPDSGGLDEVLTFLKDIANVPVKEGGKPGTWNIGTGMKLQPNLPPDAVVRYANGIRRSAGLKPFELPSKP